MGDYTLVSKYVKVRTSFAGIHQWPDAPYDVEFLKHLHRHTFFVSLTVPVNSDDREIEFFILKQKLDTFIKHRYPEVEGSVSIKFLKNKSCEMIAEDIANNFIQYHKAVDVEVSEDNENSAFVVMRQKL